MKTLMYKFRLKHLMLILLSVLVFSFMFSGKTYAFEISNCGCQKSFVEKSANTKLNKSKIDKKNQKIDSLFTLEKKSFARSRRNLDFGKIYFPVLFKAEREFDKFLSYSTQSYNIQNRCITPGIPFIYFNCQLLC